MDEVWKIWGRITSAFSILAAFLFVVYFWNLDKLLVSFYKKLTGRT